ncbi:MULTISPECIES: ABC transporter substrate-binding protein [Sodalis]|uniref:Amino acid ABC transporter substrate-binding protein (PAAT family) n=1 Tax=Sodalis ligni TaxID=2697027 RepID=A0A4R1NK68_9GAMM|nr:ABC transporter substrate-binding protein [Sodalis ligni]TCL06341.1 amino acid ABC transporter substrate-binding protein (PAAT family) [Sodalis ligni]
MNKKQLFIGAALSMSLSMASQFAFSAVTAPADIKAKGQLTFCSDLENPPAEGMAEDGKTPSGVAVDIMNALGPLMGVKTHIDNYQFSGIFAALDTGKCDLVMASLGKTPERAERYGLIDYWRVKSGLLVTKGNPLKFHTFEDLSGRRVAALLGSRNETVVKQFSDQLVKEGKPGITLVSLGTNVAAFHDLLLGRADAMVGDNVVINFYMSKAPNKFQTVDMPVPAKTWVIATLKNNTALRQAVQAGIDELNTSGAMTKIVKKWGIDKGVDLCSSSHPCAD